MRKLVTLGISGVLAGPALAADMKVTIEVPKLDVAEYHKPYVAAWIERPDGTVAANLSVWYDVKSADKKGNKWLKDLRQWWRRAGRDLDMPVDGLSSATRPPASMRSISTPPRRRSRSCRRASTSWSSRRHARLAAARSCASHSNGRPPRPSRALPRARKSSAPSHLRSNPKLARSDAHEIIAEMDGLAVLRIPRGAG